LKSRLHKITAVKYDTKETNVWPSVIHIHINWYNMLTVHWLLIKVKKNKTIITENLTKLRKYDFISKEHKKFSSFKNLWQLAILFYALDMEDCNNSSGCLLWFKQPHCILKITNQVENLYARKFYRNLVIFKHHHKTIFLKQINTQCQ